MNINKCYSAGKIDVNKYAGVVGIVGNVKPTVQNTLRNTGDGFVQLKMPNRQKEFAATLFVKLDTKEHTGIPAIAETPGVPILKNTRMLSMVRGSAVNQYRIANNKYKIKVQAETGETVEKEVSSDKDGKVELKNLKGSGKIDFTIEEIQTAQNYLPDTETKNISFTRQPITGNITMGEINGKKLTALASTGEVEITLQKDPDTTKVVTVTTIDEENGKITSKYVGDKGDNQGGGLGMVLEVEAHLT